MKTLNLLRGAALASFASAVISVPTLAQAADYKHAYQSPSAECRADEDEARVIGGIIGAVVGGVAGSQVSGNGARTEGSVVGAIAGGLLGAGIGDQAVDCNARRAERRGYTTGYNSGYSNSGYRNNGYRSAPIVQTRTVVRSGQRYGNGYQTVSHNRGNIRRLKRELQEVRWEQSEVRRKLRRLERNRYDMPRGKFRKRYNRLCDQVAHLEQRERRLKRKIRKNTNRAYY